MLPSNVCSFFVRFSNLFVRGSIQSLVHILNGSNRKSCKLGGKIDHSNFA